MLQAAWLRTAATSVALRSLPTHAARCLSSLTTASVLRFREHGSPYEVLSLRTESLPVVEESQIKVKMLAAPINPSDINVIEGKYPQKTEFPGVPGNEGVGVVWEAGSAVSHLKAGDHVVPLIPGQGTWRSAGVFNASVWHAAPADLPLAAKATLGINPATAVAMLEDFVHLKPGDIVVQNGATSAVGTAVIQYAATCGWRTVNIIRERPDWDATVHRLSSMGADIVTTPAGVRDAVKKLVAEKSAPAPSLGLNCVGGSAATAVAKCLGHGGTLVTYGGMSMQPVTLPTSLFIFKDIKAVGFWLSGGWAKSKGTAGKAQMMDRLYGHVRQGLFIPEVEEFPIADFPNAILACETNFRGKKSLLRLD